MLKFARHSRSNSMDRSNGDVNSGTSKHQRASSCERIPKPQIAVNKRTNSPPPPIPSRQKSLADFKSNSDYEAISTLCLLPGTRSVCMAPMTPTLQKIASTMASTTASCLSPKSVLKKRYDFHRAVEKLVQEKFVPNHTSSPNVPLDTSSESGYGSDQDSLNNLSQQVQTASPTVHIPPLPPRGGGGSGNGNQPPSADRKSRRKQVKFDSYVMLLQGLRDRDLDVVHSHLDQVSDAAMLTEEVSSAFLTSIVENREDLVMALLNRGFDVNSSADSAGLTGLHLAAAFNYLPIVRLLLSKGACIFALAHSSGKKAADLCSRNLPGYQACHAYLRCMEECLGVANQGKVYATQTYHTARNDELELSRGQFLTVLRKGDYPGSSWWWCTDQNGRQGYVLREVLSLNCPTVI